MDHPCQLAAARARATSASLLGEVLVIWLVFSPRAWRTGRITEGSASPVVSITKLSRMTGFWSPMRRRVDHMSVVEVLLADDGDLGGEMWGMDPT